MRPSTRCISDGWRYVTIGTTKKSSHCVRCLEDAVYADGLYASSLQVEPRLTHDIDLVVQLNRQASDELAAAFPHPDFYLDAVSIGELTDRKSQFNLIDVTTGDKVDFWILTDEPFDQSRFSRRYTTVSRSTRLREPARRYDHHEAAMSRHVWRKHQATRRREERPRVAR